jgi:hypothetical protein
LRRTCWRAADGVEDPDFDPDKEETHEEIIKKRRGDGERGRNGQMYGTMGGYIRTMATWGKMETLVNVVAVAQLPYQTVDIDG